MTFAEDLRAFVSPTDFGIEAVIDGSVAVPGIFDNGYFEPLEGIVSTQPRFVLTSADAASLTQSSQLAIGNVVYRVRAIEPDGTGMTTLRLERLS